MNNLKEYIIEKLVVNKNSEQASYKDDMSFTDNEIKKAFEDEDALKTLKFLLNFIRRSKAGDYKQSVFYYWEMGINKKYLTCQHCGWSHSREGYGYTRYIEKVIDNYNKDHGTDIQSHIAGAMADSGIPILRIKEVVDELKKKFTNVEIENENDLVSIKI